MPHRGHHDHHRAQVDLAAEEPKRRWSVPRPALPIGAAKAETELRVLAQAGRAASRLARKVGRVENVAADHADLLPRLGQEDAVGLQLERVEPRILHERWVQEDLRLAGALDRHGQDRTE